MEDLISKKEVLEKYGISYGALYRWKRMGLIPEAWFIRKSTATGQETFFRRDQVCPRVELILSRRDGTSLEQLAGELEGERQQRRSARQLIVEDRFGRREFTVEEIRSACLSDGERESSILEFLREAPL
ncbi:MAG: DUF4004 family protein [Oscillospiraceae bacterium]|nr:DUF4004 family protein [Bacillota bacterium]